MVRADHDRQIRLVELETAEEPVRVRVGIGVEQTVRIAVASEEALQAQRVAAMPRPDQHDAAPRIPDEPDAAQDEGPHDGLADVGLAADQAAELRRREARHAAVADRPPADQYLAGVEEVEFAAELARVVHGEHLGMAVEVVVEDLDRAVEDEEEVDPPLAPLEHQRPARYILLGPVAREPARRLGAEARKRLGVALVRVDRVRRGGGGRAGSVHGNGLGQRGGGRHSIRCIGAVLGAGINATGSCSGFRARDAPPRRGSA